MAYLAGTPMRTACWPRLLRNPHLLAGALGALAFGVLFGVYPLRPTAIAWLMRADPATHYLGWAFYRNGPWSAWLLGDVPGYLYPMGTSVALTDSIPLLAVPLRAVASLLPRPFQYFGLWLLGCFVLQGVASARLALRLGANRAQAVLCAVLFVWAPLLAWRYVHPTLGHASLCAHWLLLLAMTPFVSTGDAPAPRRSVCAALVVASAVHTYLFLLVGALLALDVARALAARRRIAVAPAALALGLSAVVLWSQGVLGRRVGQSPGGVGTYSANLDTFFNSEGFAAWVPGLGALEGQHEGYAYLGLGAIVLGGVAVACCLRRGSVAARRDGFAWLTCAALALALLAFAPRVAFRGRVLFDLAAHTRAFDKVLDHLRATGRFVWPLAYLIVLASVRTVLRRLPSPQATWVLGVAAALQVADAAPAWARWQPTRAMPWAPTSPAWRASAGQYRHLALFPPKFMHTSCRNRFLPWAEFAAIATLPGDLGWTLNGGYSARPPLRAVEEYCRVALAEVRGGMLRDDTVYVLTTEAVLSPLRAHLPPDARCGRLDGLAVCVAGRRDSALRRALEARPLPPRSSP